MMTFMSAGIASVKELQYLLDVPADFLSLGLILAYNVNKLGLKKHVPDDGADSQSATILILVNKTVQFKKVRFDENLGRHRYDNLVVQVLVSVLVAFS
ncbi:hypothetical protein EJB05_22271 [Eragrostis curvula]|uniref:Uncharacterized protein n=1 Tax=Eragrostis curvula TaxID=38414 RepID=A0A5J9V5S9_9POAL|nr:hypothetical protein EJB05_22271 [Eragrostis curvula]